MRYDNVLSEENLTVIEKSPGGPRQYLGQPDMVQLANPNHLITVYPIGHGRGPICLRKSLDGGESWTELKNYPKSWQDSKETPTIYRLDFQNGHQKLILISGLPKWEREKSGGFQMSLSEDDGKTWTEFEKFHEFMSNGKPNFAIVAMASLIQLKDKSGNYIDQWLGVYHTPDFRNMKTYLTFDEEGNACWSEPVPYLDDYRKIEKSHQICEVGMFREEISDKIYAFGRTQSHRHPSVYFYSSDEGNSWSEPQYLNPKLTGERHKILIDHQTGQLIVSFREIILPEFSEVYSEWMAGNWVYWAGTLEEALDSSNSQGKLILIVEDFTNSPKSGDTGYSGLVQLADGTFVMHGYGHFDEEFSNQFRGKVTDDLSYILQAKFSLQVENEI